MGELHVRGVGKRDQRVGPECGVPKWEERVGARVSGVRGCSESVRCENEVREWGERGVRK